jgi:hypothetical protein
MMRRASSKLALLFVVGCATAPPPVASPPPPVTPERGAPPPLTDARLEPPAAALRAAPHVELTGLELGTMWTFENPPLEYWRRSYDFEPSRDWLDHVRLASARYGQVCSASFVSPYGLAMTNHHCARECVEDVSTEATDHLVTGFAARTRADERVCPELHLDQLVAIEDVTARIFAAAPAGVPPEQAVEAQAVEAERVERECVARGSTADGTPVHACQVVALYHGGQHQLYQYRRYEPVKLVFAPELQAGYFGGDPDNFTYPRYTLDVAFVRAYEADATTAAATPHHFTWRAEGAAENEPVFVTGNPGSTSRLITVAQLMYEREYRHPFIVQLLAGQRMLLQAIAAQGPEAEQEVRQELFQVENSLKAFTGQLAGLRDTLLIAQKLRWEAEFRQRIRATPAHEQEYGDVWERLTALQARKLATSPRLNLANAELIGSPHLIIAAQLVRFLRQMALPEAERDDAFRGEAAQQIADVLRAPTPIDMTFAEPLLRVHLELAERWLAPDDPLRTPLLQPGEATDAATRRVLAETRIQDPDFRARLLRGGIRELETTTDPFVRVALVAEPVLREANIAWRTIQLEERAERARLGRALFAAFGTDVPPDATFTLRISDGIVQRYPYNGTIAPPFTTFYGMFARSAEFGDAMPWTLPPSIRAARARVALATPLNFVSTNDITGGNSGSPVIDRAARIVGLAFDGNIEQLPNEFVFRTETGRTIAVHAGGIVEALRSIYGMESLLNELLQR